MCYVTHDSCNITILELLQIKNFKGDFKIAKILKYPNEVRLKLNMLNKEWMLFMIF